MSRVPQRKLLDPFMQDREGRGPTHVSPHLSPSSLPSAPGENTVLRATRQLWPRATECASQRQLGTQPKGQVVWSSQTTLPSAFCTPSVDGCSRKGELFKGWSRPEQDMAKDVGALETL